VSTAGRQAVTLLVTTFVLLRSKCKSLNPAITPVFFAVWQACRQDVKQVLKQLIHYFFLPIDVTFLRCAVPELRNGVQIALHQVDVAVQRGADIRVAEVF